jgi:hypothetical protein
MVRVEVELSKNKIKIKWDEMTLYRTQYGILIVGVGLMLMGSNLEESVSFFRLDASSRSTAIPRPSTSSSWTNQKSVFIEDFLFIRM